MKATRLSIPDLVLIEPELFSDMRGAFFESYNEARFEAAVAQRARFVQDNESVSSRGVVRGMHYQLPPNAQGKLVRVVRGVIFDVAVDIRQGSPTFGRWVGVELSGDNRRQLWMPAGFAHGFMALEDNTIVNYKVTRPYHRGSEAAFRWDDLDGVILSDKDRAAPAFGSATMPDMSV
jgi:dTDP-4-dehydrorhamnose 3,5-epimerase